MRYLFNLALWPEGPSEVPFVEKCWDPKFKKNVETYFPQKCPKSISLDSGHLDKQFGLLISYFFQYFQIVFDRFSGLFFRFGDPLDPLTCISLREGVI